MKYNILGDTGLQVSTLSFGGSALGGVFRKTDDKESCEVVKTALKSGINYIDTAAWYGHGRSESVLGEALADVPRQSYYIATKCCRYMPQVDQMFDFSAERTLRSVDESLQRLRLDYVDIIQVHDMEFATSLDIVLNETLPALQKVKDSGKARFIGITGYPLENFRTIINRSRVKIDTVLTYCRGSMNDNSVLDYMPFFQEHGIGVINASPISMGLLTTRGPPSWHPAHQDIKVTTAKAAAYCKEKGVDISRLALDYSLNLPGAHTTLFSTASIENLKKNLEGVTKPLTDLEKETSKEVMEKFMLPLKNKNWEGVEVAAYRKQLESPSDSFEMGTVRSPN